MLKLNSMQCLHGSFSYLRRHLFRPRLVQSSQILYASKSYTTLNCCPLPWNNFRFIRWPMTLTYLWKQPKVVPICNLPRQRSHQPPSQWAFLRPLQTLIKITISHCSHCFSLLRWYFTTFKWLLNNLPEMIASINAEFWVLETTLISAPWSTSNFIILSGPTMISASC